MAGPEKLEPIYQLAKAVAAPPGEDLSKPWFVCETNFTLDGARTRVCDGRWATAEQARDAMKARGITV